MGGGDDPNAKVVGLAAKSYGQDGSDYVGLTPTPQGDGIQDLHIGLTGLRTDRQVSQVEVWAVGGGQWTYQGTAAQPAAQLIRASTGPGSFAPTGDLYLAPNSSFLGSDGSLTPQTLQILVRYTDGSTSGQVFLAGVLADPRLLNPVATSGNQDGHDLAQLAASPGPNGKQDVHVVLSNLPSTTPVVRVVVKRLGTGGSYQSDGSIGSWMAVLVQPQTGTATYASTADLYFEPDPNVRDLNQSYQIDIYLADTSSRPFSIVTTVTANPGLAMPSGATNATLQAKSVSAPATALKADAIAAPTAPISRQRPRPHGCCANRAFRNDRVVRSQGSGRTARAPSSQRSTRSVARSRGDRAPCGHEIGIRPSRAGGPQGIGPPATPKPLTQAGTRQSGQSKRRG